MKNLMDSTLDVDRLWRDIEELGRIGWRPGSGAHRPFGSADERAARQWLRERMAEVGCEVVTDGAGNIWGTVAGRDDLPPLVSGSHIDTVPGGGRFDGALGVLLPLAVARAIRASRRPIPRPFTVVAFTAEEPNPFGLSTLGSRAVAGVLPPDAPERRGEGGGITVAEALAMGGAPRDLWSARREPGSMVAFLEVHIEQGTGLEDKGLPVGVVSHITGIHRDRVTLMGEANHAGTTSMERRRDALAAAAEVILAVETAARSTEGLVGTAGQIRVDPNSVNVISREVGLLVEFRSPDGAALEAAVDRSRAQVRTIADRRGVRVRMQPVLAQQPVAMDPTLRRTLLDAIAAEGTDAQELVSMAGHDAVHISRLAPTAMLFVRSVGGKSHCPDEESTRADVALAARVLLRAVDVLLDR